MPSTKQLMLGPHDRKTVAIPQKKQNIIAKNRNDPVIGGDQDGMRRNLKYLNVTLVANIAIANTVIEIYTVIIAARDIPHIP